MDQSIAGEAHAEIVEDLLEVYSKIEELPFRAVEAFDFLEVAVALRQWIDKS